MTSTLPPAKQKKRSPLGAALGLFALLITSGYIVFSDLGQNIEYFSTPTEYKQREAELRGKLIRIGGLVKNVEIDRERTNLKFDISDGGAVYTVKYKGAVSDLFKENQGVIVRGKFDNNIFIANELIVKHSEEYSVPKNQTELKQMLEKNK